ncbi:HNH endonuclease [Corynebacterium propinquum]|uniref:HNH endonuclease n=1 Tax=Corynebacterium propinquum TaxID=43769 RepID=UPI0019552B6D|nr:HNH endonuclease [Corynebacterium propinquum]MDK8666009.1 HNH endonuclease [Corynebacterium propinquum]
MDADHVTAWSKGGTTDELNCEMLCIPQNRSKGNCQSRVSVRGVLLVRVCVAD